MVNPILGTLSSKGWISHPPEMLDSLMSYYINCEASQSSTAQGHVKSLKFDIANFNQNPVQLERRINDSLTVLFTAWFPEGVDVEVEVKATDPNRPTVMDILANVTVVRDNVRYNLGQQIQMLNGKVTNYMKLQEG